MSLINQMLRDLEQRNQQTPSIKPAQSLDIQISSIQHRPFRLGWWWVIGLLPITVAGWLFWQSQQTQRPATVSATPAPTVSIVKPAIQIQPPATVAAKPEQIQALTRETTTAEPVTANIPKPQAKNTVEAQKQILSPTIPMLATIAAAQANIKPSGSAAKTVKPVVTSSPEQQAEKLFRQIKSNMSRLMRRESLQEVLQLNPRHLAARQKLLRILVEEHANLELKQFLDESLGWFPDNLGFITTLAHYHLQQKNFADAIATLERVDSFRIDDTHYLSLLAAIYQQQQQFTQALPVYQKLTQVQPEKAENWLGLGICSDKLQQNQSALNAYQEALAKNTLNSAVVDYINQRLSALPR